MHTLPDPGAILRSNLNDPSHGLRYRIIRRVSLEDGTTWFACYRTTDPHGRQGTCYFSGYRLRDDGRLLGPRYGPGTTAWHCLYGPDNLHNPEAGDGYQELCVEQEAVQLTLF